MLLILDIIALAIAGFFAGYLALLSMFAAVARKRTVFPAAHVRRFAVVVPAHDEELSIERTVRSLQAIEYPRDRYSVLVVADNCTDRTASLARALGAIVHERHDDRLRGKGYALRWMFDQLLAPTGGYDAIVVIDADSVASPDFLTVMNHYLENGAEALQCNDMVEPRHDAWISEVIRFGFTLYNYVRPMGRTFFGGSAGIRGNGMCFSTALLRRVQWNAYSLNEDLEYGLKLLLAGTTVRFAPEALVHATMPATPKNAESQRSRWERGRLPVIRSYSWPLLRAAILRASFTPVDALIELVTPPFVNLFAAAALAAALHGVLLLAGVAVGPVAAAWCVVVAALALHVLVGLPAAGADAALYRAFFHIPRYALWKLSLYGKSFRSHTNGEWVRTTREAPAGDASTTNRTTSRS